MKPAWIVIGLALFVIAIAVLRRRHSAVAAPKMASDGAEEVVSLALVKAQVVASGMKRFDLQYEESTGSTRFSVDLEDARQTRDSKAPFSVVRGTLRRVASSRMAPLMNALAKLHGASSDTTLESHEKVDELPIDVAILAIGAAVNPVAWNIAGRYSTKEPGEWLVTKLFLPVIDPDEAEGEQGEIFLALNEVAGMAEFSVKDSDYWPLLSSALARIL